MDIKKIRQLLMMSQTEFSELLGVTRATISLWETGKVEPYLRSLRKIAELCEANNIPEELWKLY